MKVIDTYMETFLRGSLVKLRKVTEADKETFKKIEDNMRSRLLMNDGLPHPPTDGDHEAFLNAVSAEKDDYLFAVEAVESQAFIGTVAAYAFNWKNGTCHVGISIGESEQGKGYGTDAMSVLLQYLFDSININKVKLSVFSFNMQAIASYQKCGFQLEGTLREEIFRFGMFHDVLVMGITRTDWQARQ